MSTGLIGWLVVVVDHLAQTTVHARATTLDNDRNQDFLKSLR